MRLRGSEGICTEYRWKQKLLFLLGVPAHQSFGSPPNSVTGEKYINVFIQLNAGWSVVSVNRNMMFEICRVIKIRIVVFCVVTPSTLVGGCQYFGRKYHFCFRVYILYASFLGGKSLIQLIKYTMWHQYTTLKMEAECSSSTRTLVLTYRTALWHNPENHSMKLWYQETSRSWFSKKWPSQERDVYFRH